MQRRLSQGSSPCFSKPLDLLSFGMVTAFPMGRLVGMGKRGALGVLVPHATASTRPSLNCDWESVRPRRKSQAGPLLLGHIGQDPQHPLPSDPVSKMGV